MCGLTTEEDVFACERLGVDAVGFLLARRSSLPSGIRTNDKVTIEQAAELVRKVPATMTSVLLVHSSLSAEIRSLWSCIRPDALQLQIALTPGELTGLRRDLPSTRLIRTIHVAITDTALSVRAAVDSVIGTGIDAVLLDTGRTDRTGGTGATHDWRISQEIVQRVSPFPVILAGGLGALNVGAAVRSVRPYAVDALSSLKKGEGVKDHDQIAHFVRAATVECN